MAPLIVVTAFTALAGQGLLHSLPAFAPPPGVPVIRYSLIPSTILAGRWPRSAYPYHVSRRLARQRFEESVEAWRLYRGLIMSGRFDVNSLFNSLSVCEQATKSAADVFGEGEELIPWLQARVATAGWVESYIEREYVRGAGGRADLPSGSTARTVRVRAERELRELKERIGRR